MCVLSTRALSSPLFVNTEPKRVLYWIRVVTQLCTPSSCRPTKPTDGPNMASVEIGGERRAAFTARAMRKFNDRSGETSPPISSPIRFSLALRSCRAVSCFLFRVCDSLCDYRDLRSSPIKRPLKSLSILSWALARRHLRTRQTKRALFPSQAGKYLSSLSARWVFAFISFEAYFRRLSTNDSR